MSASFPLIDMRIDPGGQWNQVYTEESIIVPSSPPYVVRLSEVPDDGSVNSAPVISGLVGTSTYPPPSGTFYVNFDTGDIVFNGTEAGNTYTVQYWKKGSLIQADNINLLYNRLQVFDRDPTPNDDTYEVGTVWLNTSTNLVYRCFGNQPGNAIWISSLVASERSFGIEFAMGDKVRDYTLSRNNCYTISRSFIFDGTNVWTPKRFTIIGSGHYWWRYGLTGYARLYDYTNNRIICEISWNAETREKVVVSTTDIQNLPQTESVFELHIMSNMHGKYVRCYYMSLV